jgi:hypothetical protein
LPGAGDHDRDGLPATRDFDRDGGLPATRDFDADGGLPATRDHDRDSGEGDGDGDRPQWNDRPSVDDDREPDRHVVEGPWAADAEPAGTPDPDLPDDVDPRDLDPEVRAELRTLNGPLSNAVAKRLVASGTLLDEDPEDALAHAMVARRLAPRVASVREAVGLAAYHAGSWQSAIAELRTYHRITGRQTHLAVIADCERALGRPERAVDLYRAANLDKLNPDEAIELLIVAARLTPKPSPAPAALRAALTSARRRSPSTRTRSLRSSRVCWRSSAMSRRRALTSLEAVRASRAVSRRVRERLLPCPVSRTDRFHSDIAGSSPV